MRDSSEWYQPLARDLGRVWPAEHAGTRPSLLCQVELGLRLLERLDPDRSAAGVYALLSGYPFATAMGIAKTPEHQAMLTAGRHLLWRLRRGRQWTQALETYQELPERLRGYRIPAGGGPPRRVEPTVAGDRYAHYDLTLSRLPDFDRRALPLAGPGQSRFTERRRPAAVTIPEELCLDPAPGHDLGDIPRTTGRPLEVPLAELAETARWMDETEQRDGLRPGFWSQRLRDMRLDTVSADGLSFLPSASLTLNRLLHLVGMVGSGKSTLMTLIAAWGARNGLRTTLVVGDVAEQLTLSALFRGLGLPAAPVLGATTREQHAGRLHRRLAARGQDSLLTHDDPGFDYLSTACVVDALRGLEATDPLRYADAPCAGLHPAAASEPAASGGIALPERYSASQGPGTPARPAIADDSQKPAHGCPIWSACPRHAVDRELVEALIWVANPASLLQSAVPQHLNQERLRHLELACLRSDIIIVDEVDRVQMQLDTAFAPSATLVVRGPESWLDRLHTHKIDELARGGRLQLSERDVQRWAASLEVVTTATNRLYGMLIDNEDLRAWAEIEYFSAWTLQEKLLAEWYPQPELDATPPDGIRADTDVYDPGEEGEAGEPEPGAAAAQPWAEHRQDVTQVLDKFRDDPLGDNGPYGTDTDDLIRAASDLLHTLNEKGTRGRVRAALDLLLRQAPILDGSLAQPDAQNGEGDRDSADIWGTEEWYERTATRLEFSLLLAVLHQRLDRITFLWPQVEAALRLDRSDNELSHRPPLDYAPLVPEAPMGNVLGFQYLPDDPEPGAADDLRSGTLRFFRCAGVGRELLLHLPSLGADPAAGRDGPHVLLMSGTSWAGTSTRAHVLVPVGAVLKPQEEALEAIRQTSFHTHFLYDGDGNPLTLSGSNVETRPAVLRQMVSQLGRSGPGQPSLLDQELRQIADETRRRALLLVGSYPEATAAADLLGAMPRWRGRVKVLAADDADLDHAGPGDANGTDTVSRAAALRRGDLASFADDPDAELLVAPLMAVERGHNILNKQRKAAFGTVIFLARPHPRPDDLSLAVFAVNDWVTRFVRDQPGLRAGTFSKMVAGAGDLDAAARAFRREARREWRRLLWRPYIYSRLDDDEKESFAWDQMVTIWQVMGRLVRGGVPARVIFTDAAFAPALAEATAPPPPPSGTPAAKPRRSRRRRTDEGLLTKLRSVLAPYFEAPAGPVDPHAFANPADPALVRTLYHPLYQALCRLRNTTPGAPIDDPASSD